MTFEPCPQKSVKVTGNSPLVYAHHANRPTVDLDLLGFFRFLIGCACRGFLRRLYTHDDSNSVDMTERIEKCIDAVIIIRDT